MENKKKGRYKGNGKGRNEQRGSMSTLQGLNKLLGNVAFIGRYDEPEPNIHIPIADTEGIEGSSESHWHGNTSKRFLQSQ